MFYADLSSFVLRSSCCLSKKVVALKASDSSESYLSSFEEANLNAM